MVLLLFFKQIHNFTGPMWWKTARTVNCIERKRWWYLQWSITYHHQMPVNRTVQMRLHLVPTIRILSSTLILGEDTRHRYPYSTINAAQSRGMSSEISNEQRNHIDSLVEDCSNPSALAMELLQSCIKPSTLAINNGPTQRVCPTGMHLDSLK